MSLELRWSVLRDDIKQVKHQPLATWLESSPLDSIDSTDKSDQMFKQQHVTMLNYVTSSISISVT